MRNHVATEGRARAALPSLVLALMLVAGLLVSGARAEDPPIVSVGPVGSSANTASGSAGSGGQAGVCVNDQKSSADPSSSDPAKVNEGTCQSAASSSSSAGSNGSTASTGATAGSGVRTANATASVAAANAVGVRIVRVRHLTKGVGVTKRFRVLVTLRDLRGKRVQGAIVSASRVPGARITISGVHSTFSNRLGEANIAVPVTRSMLGKRLFLKIAARTPKARSIALRSVHLPAIG